MWYNGSMLKIMVPYNAGVLRKINWKKFMCFLVLVQTLVFNKKKVNNEIAFRYCRNLQIKNNPQE